MSHNFSSSPPADSGNVMSKKPRLCDTGEEHGSAMEVCGGKDGEVTKKRLNGFEELGLLEKAGSGFSGKTVSRESDGNVEGSVERQIGVVEAEKEKLELGFDLNYPFLEAAKEGSAQFGRKICERRAIIDLEAENDGEQERTELGFGYGGNGDLGGVGLGNVESRNFEGVVASLSKRRSSSREDKGKEKVDDGDWLQLCTGSMPLAPPRSTSGLVRLKEDNSDDKRSYDSLSFGLK